MTALSASDITVNASTSLEDAIRTIDRTGSGIVFVVDDEGELLGTATDGDIRRGILDGVDLSAPVVEVMNQDPITVHDTWSEGEISDNIPTSELTARVSEYDHLTVPVLDDDRLVVGVTHLSPDGKAVDRVTDEPTNVETVLVIGGAGYIGSVLCQKLLSQRYSVRILDNLTYGDHGIRDLLDHEEFTLIEGDMRSIEDVIDSIQGVDAVVHLGALVGDPASAIDPQKTLELNYHSVKLAAEICKYHQINRFLFASTCSVYGQSEDPEELLTEESTLNPVSLYAQTKIESERALLDMADSNFSPTILRMATIYGLSPRMRFDLVVNILSAKAHEEGVIPIYGGEQYRPNVHVADAAQAYIDCLEAPIEDVASEVLNVGSNAQNYRIEEIGHLISEVFPDAELEFDREKEDDRSYQVDFQKIHDELDYSVSHTIPSAAREIKDAFEGGVFEDYTADEYSNYRTLEDRMPI
ncbi:MAG: NAD-dependent epimerase/dehydratase family protein [Haloferacaceae archaeon]